MLLLPLLILLPIIASDNKQQADPKQCNVNLNVQFDLHNYIAYLHSSRHSFIVLDRSASQLRCVSAATATDTIRTATATTTFPTSTTTTATTSTAKSTANAIATYRTV